MAARFCLLYDDGRWSLKKDRNVGEDEGGPVEEERTTEGRSSSGTASKKGDVQSKRTPEVGEEVKSHVESDLLRVLAEVNLINAEVMFGSEAEASLKGHVPSIVKKNIKDNIWHLHSLATDRFFKVR